MKKILILFVWAVLFGCQSQTQTTESETTTPAPTVQIIKTPELEALMSQSDDKLRILNFWATWCAPCIKELPHFEALAAENPDIELILISLDFKEDLDKKVIPFLEKRNIKAKVLLIDETDYNSWLDKVDESWEGSIPATLVINNAKNTRKFEAKSFDEASLNAFVFGN